jgi:hypothetical protein
MKQAYAYVVVYSTSHALHIEKILAQQQIDCKLVPVPRQLSSDCGVCVRITADQSQTVEQIVVDTGIEIEGVYLV